MSAVIQTDARGFVSGSTVPVVIWREYGSDARLMRDRDGDIWPGYVGAIVRDSGHGRNSYDVLDYVRRVSQ